MFDIGGGELLLIVLVVLIMFGPKKLPELAQSLGRGLREFKRAQREFTDTINTAMNDEQRRERARSSHIPPTDTVPREPIFPSTPPTPETITFTGEAPPDAEIGGAAPDTAPTNGTVTPETKSPDTAATPTDGTTDGSGTPKG